LGLDRKTRSLRFYNIGRLRPLRNIVYIARRHGMNTYFRSSVAGFPFSLFRNFGSIVQTGSNIFSRRPEKEGRCIIEFAVDCPLSVFWRQPENLATTANQGEIQWLSLAIHSYPPLQLWSQLDRGTLPLRLSQGFPTPCPQCKTYRM
jgi:hypothetical protein